MSSSSVLHPEPREVESAVRTWEACESKRPVKKRGSRESGGGSCCPYAWLEEEEHEVLEGPWVGLRVCDGPIWAVSCSTRGSVAAACSDGAVRVRKLGAAAKTLRDERESVVSSPSASSAGLDLRGHGGAVLDVAWAPPSSLNGTGSALSAGPHTNNGRPPPEESSSGGGGEEEETLVSVSEDRSARLWRLDGRTSEAACILVCAHGGAVACCAFLDGETFATGGLDRTVRLWHAPSGRATAWAHCNDAVTAIAATKVRVQGPKHKDGRRIAVGLRGGQIFAYTSKHHQDMTFDEMFLSTMRSGAFLEAERVGASGLSPDDGVDFNDEPDDTPASFLPETPSKALARKSRLRKLGTKLGKMLGGSSKGKKGASSSLSHRPETIAEEAAPPQSDNADDDAGSSRLAPTPRNEKIDDGPPPPPQADDPSDASTRPPAATVAFVEHRVSHLAWYAAPTPPRLHNDDPPVELHERVRLLAAANQSRSINVYPGARPDKPCDFRLDGGARLLLGCGARPSASGKVAVGASETGHLLFWRLDEADPLLAFGASTRPDSPSYESSSQQQHHAPQQKNTGTTKTAAAPAPLVKACASKALDLPNARVSALTAAVFAPAQAAKKALADARFDLSSDDDDDIDWSAALALATDYSGRLLLVPFEAASLVRRASCADRTRCACDIAAPGQALSQPPSSKTSPLLSRPPLANLQDEATRLSSETAQPEETQPETTIRETEAATPPLEEEEEQPAPAPLETPVDVAPVVPEYTQRAAVDETDAAGGGVEPPVETTVPAVAGEVPAARSDDETPTGDDAVPVQAPVARLDDETPTGEDELPSDGPAASDDTAFHEVDAPTPDDDSTRNPAASEETVFHDVGATPDDDSTRNPAASEETVFHDVGATPDDASVRKLSDDTAFHELDTNPDDTSSRHLAASDDTVFQEVGDEPHDAGDEARASTIPDEEARKSWDPLAVCVDDEDEALRESAQDDPAPSDLVKENALPPHEGGDAFDERGDSPVNSRAIHQPPPDDETPDADHESTKEVLVLS